MLKATRLGLTLAMVVGSACTHGTGKTDTATQARLAAAENKLARLEERLAVVEEKSGKLDGVAEGVQILLEQLEQLGAGKPKRREPDPDLTYSMPVEGNAFIGPEHAKVVLVKGFDFYCGYCDKVRPTLTQLQKEFGKDLKIVFKHFVIHEDVARLPALAACAAQQQGKFMPMFDRIWEAGIRARQELGEERLLALAAELKLKKKKFLADMYGDCEKQVQRDFTHLSAVGATGTPVFFINGRFIAGALPIDRYRIIIEEELEKANAAIKAGSSVETYYPSLVESGLKRLQ